ncbi:gamma-glutamylcyclotransferase family protein [Cohnella sp. AR92]|uniref:gamma-glutamylcyclotransferase family protein n=1 Tax=Cohnella sp. AR92 TaxID=648716 RepID=UPI000F8E82FB|nr:gamma-glutamylcyclotransferase family protein [Cohnella sp. AR92]RUS44607.1 gamma-glutamylcyclotransferase [Cohnella sp. AR92]
MSSIYYAAYGININTVEMKRKFNAHLVGKGYLEGFDLDFYGFPIMKPYPNMKVPVVVWQLPGKAQSKLDYDEFINIGDFNKEYLNVKLEAITDQVIKVNMPRNEIKALVYTSRISNFEPNVKIPLTTYNILFQAYTEQHHFDTDILVRAALKANTRYQKYEFAKYERQQELMHGLKEENPELVCSILVARWLINIKP